MQRTVQRGYASPTTTMRVYTHSIQAAQAATADLMNELLASEPRRGQGRRTAAG